MSIRGRFNPLQWTPSEVQLVALVRRSVEHGLQVDAINLTADECIDALNRTIARAKQLSKPWDLRAYYDGILPRVVLIKMGEADVDLDDHISAVLKNLSTPLEHAALPTREQRNAQLKQLAAEIEREYPTPVERDAAWTARTSLSTRARRRHLPRMYRVSVKPPDPPPGPPQTPEPQPSPTALPPAPLPTPEPPPPTR